MSSKLSGIIFAAVLLFTGCSRQRPLIFHIVDTHYVNRDDFAADLRDQNPNITDEEIESEYADLLKGVETVQERQETYLRRLIADHGIKTVFVEGVTESNVDDFRSKVKELRDIDLADLQRQLQESDDYTEQAALLVEIETFQAQRLQLGAVGKLMIEGVPIDVMPLDDDELLAKADPTKNGFRFDGPENEARERAMAQKLCQAGPVAAFILGGAHHLGDDIKAINPEAKYVVMMTGDEAE